jgi:hypothetical protein
MGRLKDWWSTVATVAGGVAFFVAFAMAGVMAGRMMDVVAGVVTGDVAGVTTDVVVGVVTGGVASVVAFVVASVVTSGVASDMTFVVASVVASSVAVVVASGIAGVMASDMVDVVVSAIASVVTSGMADDALFVVALVVWLIMVLVVALIAASGVSFFAAVGVSFFSASRASLFVASGVVLVVASGVSFFMASGVATCATALSSLPLPLLVVVGVLLGVSLGGRRWSWSTPLRRVALLGLISLVSLLIAPAKTLFWLIAFALGFLRLPIYAMEAAGSVLAYARLRLPLPFIESNEGTGLILPIWHYDELIPFPLPFLDHHLVVAAQRDRRAGLALIEQVAGTWRQGVMARRALVQLAAIELTKRDDEQSIAAAARDLAWLPEIPSPIVQGTLGRFRTISAMLDEKRSLTDSEAQLAQLSRTTATLDEMIQGLTFVPSRERELFLPVAQQWRAVLRRATTRLPNPYVAGGPLRGDKPGLFVGREDVLRDLLAHLRDRSQRPTLVLFAQRCMGKTSLLYQLPYKFDAQTVPVFVDCQAAEMQESDTVFLFNLARAIQRQAQEFRQIEFPPPPSLAEMTATAFSQWLEAVESQLGGRVLLLCLDEFERIGEAVNRGWLDERILDFLRNLIQHHSQVTLLLAGSHRPAEIGRPWSNYLISAVVLPISYLRPEDVEKLVTQPIPGFPLYYKPEAVQHIIQLTRCQPLLVQLLCQQLVILLNERGEREAGVAEIEAAVPGALSQGGTLYFTYLAEYDAGVEGQVMLRELALHGPGAVLPEDTLTHGEPARQEALRRLLARDLVERADGGIRFEVELTRRWWAEYGPGDLSSLPTIDA